MAAPRLQVGAGGDSQRRAIVSKVPRSRKTGETWGIPLAPHLLSYTSFSVQSRLDAAPARCSA